MNVSAVGMERATWVYVSGEMSGVQGHNYRAFNDAAARLREAGLRVLNPAENHGGLRDLPRDAYMRVDLTHVLMVDAVVVLPGWENSPGARLEVAVAQEAGIAILDTNLEPVSVVITTAAA